MDIDVELYAAPSMLSVTRVGEMTMLLQIAARDIRQLTDIGLHVHKHMQDHASQPK